jgi:hypothetical protein
MNFENPNNKSENLPKENNVVEFKKRDKTEAELRQEAIHRGQVRQREFSDKIAIEQLRSKIKGETEKNSHYTINGYDVESHGAPVENRLKIQGLYEKRDSLRTMASNPYNDAKKLNLEIGEVEKSIDKAVQDGGFVFKAGEKVSIGRENRIINRFDSQTGDAIFEEQEKVSREILNQPNQYYFDKDGKPHRGVPQKGETYLNNGKVFIVDGFDSQTGDLLLKREFNVSRDKLRPIPLPKGNRL